MSAPARGPTPVGAANMAVVERRWPEIARQLKAVTVRADTISIERSARGYPTIAVTTPKGKEYIEDPNDPAAAGKRAAAAVPEGVRLVVCLGMGLGYHLKALLARREIEQVIVLEPSIAFLVLALSLVDLRRVLDDPRVDLEVAGDPDEAARGVAARHNHGTEPGRILTLLPPTYLMVHRSAAVDAAWSERVRLVLGDIVRSSERNRRAFEEFVDLWRRNFLANVGPIARARGFADIEGRCRGVAAVVVGAGPSLDMAAEVLAGSEDRLLIIATDTALRTLRAAGVRPHLVMSLDATEANVGDFDGVDVDGSALAMIPVIDPRIPPLFDRAFVGGYGHPWMKFLELRWGRVGSVLVSGSVSTAAYDLARTLGASPIILAGVDLAYVGGRTHTRGRIGPAEVEAAGRFRTIETIARGWAEKTEREMDLPATGGGTVRTTQRMKEWKEWFEREIRQGTPTVQTSAGGLRIEGAAEMSLSEAVRRFGRRRAGIDHRLAVPPPRRDIRRVVDDLRRIAAEARAALETPEDADPLEGRVELAFVVDWERATWGAAGIRRVLRDLPGDIERALRGLGASSPGP